MRLRRDKIVVALEHKVLMYNFADLRLEHSTETASNPKGLVALSAAPEHNVVACPGLHCGQVSILETIGATKAAMLATPWQETCPDLLFQCLATALLCCGVCIPDMSSTSLPLQVRVELYDVRRTKFITAHTSALACIALSQDGKMLATASERGTLVRVHSTFDGTKLQVLFLRHCCHPAPPEH